MAHRTFVDRIGMTWEVWDVRPNAAVLFSHDGAGALQELANGWLCFQSGSTRKRLAPIPANWADLPEDELVRLWRLATPAPSRGPTAVDQAPSRDRYTDSASRRESGRPTSEPMRSSPSETSSSQ
jgi:hypothetical protein